MANLYVTAAGAGTKDGSSWANAMDFATFQVSPFGDSSLTGAVDVFFMGGQTYTITDNRFVTINEDVTQTKRYIGVASGTTAEPPTTADWATGDDRPVIATGAYYIRTDYYQSWFNFRFSGTGSFGIYARYYGFMWNIEVINTNAAAGIYGIYVHGNYFVANCYAEIQSSSTTAIAIVNSGGGIVHKCFIKSVNGGKGFISNSNCQLTDCIIMGGGVENSRGIDAQASVNVNYFNNTIYNFDNGIFCASGQNLLVAINNIFSECTIGINQDIAEHNNNLIFNNNFHNCGTDTVNVSTVWGSLSVDPEFADAAGGDFSVPISSPMVDAGFPLGFGVGGLSKNTIGAYQPTAFPDSDWFPEEGDVRDTIVYGESDQYTGTMAAVALLGEQLRGTLNDETLSGALSEGDL
jgi:hypothetical protein